MVRRCSSPAAPSVVVMACTWMILVKIAVQVPQGAMIGTVLSLTIKAFLVCSPECLVQLAMKSPMRPVITSVLTIVVIVGEGSCCRCGYGQHRRRNESFADGHGLSPSDSRKSQGELHFETIVLWSV